MSDTDPLGGDVVDFTQFGNPLGAEEPQEPTVRARGRASAPAQAVNYGVDPLGTQVPPQSAAKSYPMMTPQDEAERARLAAIIAKAPQASDTGTAFLTGLDAMNLGPRLAASMDANRGLGDYQDRLRYYSQQQADLARRHPYAAGAGWTLGQIPSAIVSTVAPEFGAIGRAAPYVMSGAQNVLMNTNIDKGDILPALSEFGTGVAAQYGANKLFGMLRPEGGAIQEQAINAAKRLGVSLPAAYASGTQALERTTNQIGNLFTKITGGIDPEQSARNALDTFRQYILSPVGRTQTAGNSRAAQSANSALNHITHFQNNWPEASAIDIIKNMPYRAMSGFYTTIKNQEPQIAKDLQNGFANSFKNNIGNIHNELQSLGNRANIIFSGRGDLKGLRRDTGAISLATQAKDAGENLLSRAGERAVAARTRAGDVVSDIASRVAFGNIILRATPIGAAEYAATQLAGLPHGAGALIAGGLAGAKATAAQLAKRNIANPLSNVERAVVAQTRQLAVPRAANLADRAQRGVHSYLEGAANTVLGTGRDAKGNADKNSWRYWYQEHAPWILGGRAEGGRIQRKSGGRIESDPIERLVSGLMIKAKKAKMAQAKSTEPMLDQHDDTIAKALNVAQKAI